MDELKLALAVYAVLLRKEITALGDDRPMEEVNAIRADMAIVKRTFVDMGFELMLDGPDRVGVRLADN